MVFTWLIIGTCVELRGLHKIVIFMVAAFIIIGGATLLALYGL